MYEELGAVEDDDDNDSRSNDEDWAEVTAGRQERNGRDVFPWALRGVKDVVQRYTAPHMAALVSVNTVRSPRLLPRPTNHRARAPGTTTTSMPTDSTGGRIPDSTTRRAPTTNSRTMHGVDGNGPNNSCLVVAAFPPEREVQQDSAELASRRRDDGRLGLVFTHEEAAYDGLGVSVAWRRAVSDEEEEEVLQRRERAVQAWRAKSPRRSGGVLLPAGRCDERESSR